MKRRGQHSFHGDGCTHPEVAGGPPAFAREALSGVRILDSRIVPEFTELQGTGAAPYGSYVEVIELPGQGTMYKYGRYAAVAERDSGGKWRLTRLTALTDSSPPYTADDPTSRLLVK